MSQILTGNQCGQIPRWEHGLRFHWLLPRLHFSFHPQTETGEFSHDAVAATAFFSSTPREFCSLQIKLFHSSHLEQRTTAALVEGQSNATQFFLFKISSPQKSDELPEILLFHHNSAPPWETESGSQKTTCSEFHGSSCGETSQRF